MFRDPAMVRCYPAVLRRDNGPELAREVTADWAGERVGLSVIPLGDPWRNGYDHQAAGRRRAARPDRRIRARV